MNARDLPGPGDAATWGACSKHPNSPDYDERWQDPSTIDDDMAAVREWIDAFESAACRRNRFDMLGAKSVITSSLDALIKEWQK